MRQAVLNDHSDIKITIYLVKQLQLSHITCTSMSIILSVMVCLLTSSYSRGLENLKLAGTKFTLASDDDDDVTTVDT